MLKSHLSRRYKRHQPPAPDLTKLHAVNVSDLKSCSIEMSIYMQTSSRLNHYNRKSLNMHAYNGENGAICARERQVDTLNNKRTRQKHPPTYPPCIYTCDYLPHEQILGSEETSTFWSVQIYCSIHLSPPQFRALILVDWCAYIRLDAHTSTWCDGWKMMVGKLSFFPSALVTRKLVDNQVCKHGSEYMDRKGCLPSRCLVHQRHRHPEV